MERSEEVRKYIFDNRRKLTGIERDIIIKNSRLTNIELENFCTFNVVKEKRGDLDEENIFNYSENFESNYGKYIWGFLYVPKNKVEYFRLGYLFNCST